MDRMASGVRLEAWESLLRVHAQVLGVLEADLQHMSQMPLRWYDVLLELNRAPGKRLRMTELGERVVLSRSRISRVVEELESEGLVGRQQDPLDRRSWFACLTREGTSRFRRSAPHYLRGIQEQFGKHLREQEAAAIRNGLGRVLEDAKCQETTGASRAP